MKATPRAWPLALATLMALATHLPAPARAQQGAEARELSGLVMALGAHGSLLTDIQERSVFSMTAGYSARLGWRWGRWGAFGMLEHNMWFGQDRKDEMDSGVVDIAGGGELLFLNGHARVALALGISVLTFDTVFDEAGQTGAFMDARPLGLRWRLTERLVLGLDPLTVTMVAPVLHEPMLIYPQYRTVLYLEVAP
jgi:hypothetical protein